MKFQQLIFRNSGIFRKSGMSAIEHHIFADSHIFENKTSVFQIDNTLTCEPVRNFNYLEFFCFLCSWSAMNINEF